MAYGLMTAFQVAPPPRHPTRPTARTCCKAGRAGLLPLPVAGRAHPHRRPVSRPPTGRFSPPALLSVTRPGPSSPRIYAPPAEPALGWPARLRPGAGCAGSRQRAGGSLQRSLAGAGAGEAPRRRVPRPQDRACADGPPAGASCVRGRMIRRAAQNLGLAFAPLVVSPLLPSPGRTGPDVGPDEYRELYAAALLVFAGLAAAATGVTLLLVAVDRCAAALQPRVYAPPLRLVAGRPSDPLTVPHEAADALHVAVTAEPGRGLRGAGGLRRGAGAVRAWRMPRRD